MICLVNSNRLRAFTFGKQNSGIAYGFNWKYEGIDYSWMGGNKSYAMFSLWKEGEEAWHSAEEIDGRTLQEMAETIAVQIPVKDLYAEYKRWAGVEP